MTQTITCKLTFPMGHALHGYVGKCSSLHGHNYTVEATVYGEPDPLGLVFDYGTLRDIMRRVLREFDHTMVLHKDDPRGPLLLSPAASGSQTQLQRLITLSCNPSAELLAQLWYKLLEREIRNLHRVVVTESELTSATAYTCSEDVHLVEASNV